MYALEQALRSNDRAAPHPAVVAARLRLIERAPDHLAVHEVFEMRKRGRKPVMSAMNSVTAMDATAPFTDTTISPVSPNAAFWTP